MQQDSDTIFNNAGERLHKLNGSWTLWAHLPHDVSWDVESYKKIDTFSTVEHAIELLNKLPENLIKNCMLFVMRDGILPIWEDKNNCKGGCFSFKVNNKNILSSWKDLMYKLISENLIDNDEMSQKFNGITISPKRNFCIVKIWLVDCTIQDPETISDVQGLSKQGCLFKKHNPEY